MHTLGQRARSRSRASIGVETLARAPPPCPAKTGRTRTRACGERCTVVMSLPALRPPRYPPSPLKTILDSRYFVARKKGKWEILAISNGVGSCRFSHRVFEAERRFITLSISIDLFFIITSTIIFSRMTYQLVRVPLHAGYPLPYSYSINEEFVDFNSDFTTKIRGIGAPTTGDFPSPP